MANPKLNDLQLILLSTASQRGDGSVLPAADSIAKDMKRVRAAIPALLKRKLVEEVPIKDRRLMWREEDEQPLGLAISEAGRAIIAPDDAAKAAPKTKPAKEKASTAPRAPTKVDIVIGLLRRPAGATLNEVVNATGWLPHTTRATLTGLRKKGHVVEKSKRDDATCYRIAGVA